MRLTTPFPHILAILLIPFLFSSCSVKKAVYFSDLSSDSLAVARQMAPYSQPVIAADDILTISIQTIDPTTSAVVNQTVVAQAVGSSTAGMTGGQQFAGFLVDREGYVQLNLIGRVKVAGLTTSQAKGRIAEIARKYYSDPNVEVRFANFKITVLGEVTRPATYMLPNEKVSILDALGLAGDLTIYGRRDNLLLMRDEGNEKKLVRLNLNDSHTLSSPYFYLRQNDVIYVEPGKGRAAADVSARLQPYAILGTVASILGLIISRF